MNKDLEPSTPGELQPMFGPEGHASSQYIDHGAPEWWDALPPFGAGDSWKDQIERAWALTVRPVRYMAIMFMLLTYSVWRFLAWTVSIGLIISVIIFKM
jgi:hypothetical protein